jgi:chemotaxis protein MotB
LLKTLAEELGKLPNTLAMEGHTDSKPYAAGSNYGNWELSSDRANAARRLMQLDGIRADQVTQVRGFADQRLRKKEDPLDAANRRISLIVQYLSRPEPLAGAAGKPKRNQPKRTARKKTKSLERPRKLRRPRKARNRNELRTAAKRGLMCWSG